MSIHPAFLLAVLLPATLVAHPEHNLRHWEQASPDPDRIILTWTGDPSTTQAVSWRTDTSIKKAEAEIALALPKARFDEGAKSVEARTEKLETVLAKNPCKWTIVTMHHPMFSSGSGRDNAKNRKVLKPVIDKYQVDLLDRKAINTPFFQVIDVDGEWLTYRAFMANGELYDAVKLRKLPNGSKELHPWKDDLGKER